MGTWIKFILSSVYIKCLIMNSIFCDWSYQNSRRWEETWKHCAGMHQSPVNIIDSEAATLTKQIALTFKNFGTPLGASLTNNGKTAKLELPSGSNVSVTGNRLYINNLYKLEEVHFHWGMDTHSGSEHKINGKSASLEVHLVHYNLKYASFETARKMFDGVLTLSTLVDVSTNVSQNSFWKGITDELSDVIDPGSKKQLGNVKFSDFLPRNRDDFYLYKGSFTTPPCYETVTWVLFKERLLVPEEYLQRFYDLKTNDSGGSQERLASNIRPVKPLNSRTVLKTFQSPGSKDSKNHVYEKVLHGEEVIGVLRFYQCHVPTSVSLSIIIPSSDITWKSQNLTSDIPKRVPLDATKSYGVTLEIHDHPKGHNKDNVHVTVKLNGNDIIYSYYNLNKDCLQDSCSWSPVGKSRTCTQRLIDTDEELLFTLTRQKQCDNVYDITIKKNNSVVFETAMKPKTRLKVTPHAVDQRLNKTLGRWYLVLNVTKNNTSHAKLFLDLPYSVLSSQGVLMEGLYQNGPNCDSSPSGTVLIIGITVGLFILAVIILTICLVFRTIRNSPKLNILVQEDELDTAV